MGEDGDQRDWKGVFSLVGGMGHVPNKHSTRCKAKRAMKNIQRKITVKF